MLASDPGNTDWQSDLFVAYQNLGDVFMAQGKSADALAAFQKDLAIANQLAAGQDNAKRRRNIFASHSRIG